MKYIPPIKKLTVLAFILCSQLPIICNGEQTINDECGNCTTIIHKMQGTVVDCRFRNFYRVPNCKVNNIKSIYLTSNRIVTIHQDAFQAMKTLHVIYLDKNKIEYIHEKAFHDLIHLKELYLEYNNLQQRSFSKNTLNSLRNLQVLYLCQNPIGNDEHHILENAISRLTNLRSLYLPGINGLEFGNSFTKFSKLNKLIICFYEHFIYSEKTFQGFVNNTIQYLEIHPEILHKNTFSNFKNLRGLTVNSHETILIVLESLWPFVNKTFDYLRIGNNKALTYSPVITITSNDFKYLGQICTTELDLSFNNILHISHAAIFTLNYISCIRKVDLSGNLLTSPMFVELSIFPNLEYLNVCFNGRNRIAVLSQYPQQIQMTRRALKEKVIFQTSNFPLSYRNNTISKSRIIPHFKSRNTPHFKTRTRNHNFTNMPNDNVSLLDKRQGTAKVSSLEKNIFNSKLFTPQHWINNKIIHQTNIKIKPTFLSSKDYKHYQNHEMTNQDDSYLTVFLCPKLKFLNMSHTYIRGAKNMTISGGKNLDVLDLSFSNMQCNFYIEGIPNLVVLNVSHCQCQYLNPSFLQHYPKLQVFVASHTNLNIGLAKVPDKESLFKGLTKLEHVDLAYNNLRFLPSKLFQNQSESLKSLILSGNFLFPVPNNLLNLTRLTYLDLSYNNYTLFSNSDIHVITTLTSRGTRIRLEGNKFICTCDTGDFIRWLFTIKTMIDFKRIHCVMNNGTWKFLTDMNNVRYDFHLGCSSKFWLIFSISGISVLTVALLLSVIAYRYRLDIEFFIFRCYWRLYPRQPFTDYHHDVFIAASNEDVPWVCSELIKFLDEKVKVKTFYYHKDALPSQSIGDMICENIQKSRKIIFVITDAFLKSPWLGFELDQARMYMYKMYSEKNILIILKGDISIKKCPDIIKTIHSKILFLQYPIDVSEEELNIFWKKLEKCFENHDTAQNEEETCSHSGSKPV